MLSIYSRCILRFDKIFANIFCIVTKIYKSSNSCRNYKNAMKILNVAEKNDAAKNIAGILSSGNYKKMEGLSKYNKIYYFNYHILGNYCQMIVTSVSGHLLNLEFSKSYKRWSGCHPLSLFNASVKKICPTQYSEIKKTLQNEATSCHVLIIWTDCDREGENIGSEIVDVCQEVKPDIQVLRAKFSDFTVHSILQASKNLQQLDSNLSNAVDVRQELDLRIGAAFTRFQTLRLTRIFPNVLSNALISYGSCQFPTLGFVVERFQSIQNFISEQFWKIVVVHTCGDGTQIEFHWKRVRLFEKNACQVFHDICCEINLATVLKTSTKVKNKWRPLPLDTVTLEKVASKKLHLTAKEVMEIAEKLYTSGIISYPRTETNIFPKDLNLSSLIELQCQDPRWGDFARKILDSGGPNPRQGQKTDNAHPPIHPTKWITSLNGNEARLFEFIVRHFLACCSSDALGQETQVEIEIGGENFSANGLMVLARNYLDVYPYDQWNTKIIPVYQEGQTFVPSDIVMIESQTTPPKLLTEADLIALMDLHGIGTDATHAEHIETIKTRGYVTMQDNKYLIPSQLGLGLIKGYDNMGLDMSKPNLRAGLEMDLKDKKNPQTVLKEQLMKYQHIFKIALEQAKQLDSALEHHFGPAQQIPESELMTDFVPNIVMQCPLCNDQICLRIRQNGSLFLSCAAYPECKAVIWLPEIINKVEVLSETCSNCLNSPHLLNIKVNPKSNLASFIPSPCHLCICGCDQQLTDILQIRLLNTNSVQIRSQNQSLTVRQSFHTISSNCNSFPQCYCKKASTKLSVHKEGRQFYKCDNKKNPCKFFQWADISLSENILTQNASSLSLPLSVNPVTCNCGIDALLLTVRKDGINKGRQFYKCAKSGTDACNFFLWANDSQLEQTTVKESTHLPLCDCGILAQRTILQEGISSGRPYFCCSKKKNRCGFFQWADLKDSQSSGTGNKLNRAITGKTKKRKCGICNETGHTRKTCPNQ